MSEQWKFISGFDKAYKVSNTGKVYSCARKSSDGRQLRGRLLKPWVVASSKIGDCLSVTLRRDNKSFDFMVSRLVAEAFLEDGKGEVHHKDFNPRNNNTANLEYREKSSAIKSQYGSGSRQARAKGHHKAENVLSIPRTLISKEIPSFGYWAPNTVEAAKIIGAKPASVTDALSKGYTVYGFYVFGERRSDAKNSPTAPTPHKGAGE